MRLFLTGASGYIGQAVVRALQVKGYSVIGLSRSGQVAKAIQAQGVEPWPGDLRDPASFLHGLQQVDGIIHVAAENGPDTYQIDHNAVKMMIEALQGTKKVFVYTSGALLYGDTGDQPADEAHPLLLSPFTQLRAKTEQVVLQARSRAVRGIVLRPAFVYGCGGGTMLRSFAQSVRQEGVARYIGTGDNRWSSVHVDDLADVYVRALDYAPDGTLLNVAADSPAIPVRVLAEHVSSAMGAGGKTVSWPLEEARHELGPFADLLTLNQLISGWRAMQLLQWQPTHQSILQEIEQWFTGTAAKDHFPLP